MTDPCLALLIFVALMLWFFCGAFGTFLWIMFEKSQRRSREKENLRPFRRPGIFLIMSLYILGFVTLISSFLAMRFLAED